MSLFQDATGMHYITDMPLSSPMSCLCTTEEYQFIIQLWDYFQCLVSSGYANPDWKLSEGNYHWLIKQQCYEKSKVTFSVFNFQLGNAMNTKNGWRFPDLNCLFIEPLEWFALVSYESLNNSRKRFKTKHICYFKMPLGNCLVGASLVIWRLWNIVLI